ncbi:MAG: DNA primase [Clostridia bacterium]|nr:DNA primase [Clostridia bacterium]
MTIFDKVKSAVSVKDAADRYGLEFDRKGMARCPFHDDHHPSLKLNEDYYYCFGCGEHGDAIALTAGLLGLKPGEAARRMAEDFGIGEDFKPSVMKQLKSYSSRVADERRCFLALSDYLQFLREWKTSYAPQPDIDEPDPRFLEACRMIEPITYWIDLLITGDTEQKNKLVKKLKEDGKLSALEKYLEEIRGENKSSEERK